MSTVWKCIAAFALLLLVSSSAARQSSLTLCDLLRNADKYNGQVVKIRATWTYGYEWSYLHCLGCDGRIWLDTRDTDERSDKLLNRIPKGAGTVNIDVEGFFETGQTYGHQNGYKYQLTARTITRLAVVYKGMKAIEKDREVERKYACGGTNPR